MTIAGSDSGGGAGLQADLRAFEASGVHGVCALTCVTAQNPVTVDQVVALAPRFVQAQLTSLFQELRPGAAKTGMLVNEGVVRGVASWWKRHGAGVPLVIDPVMISTSGVRLLSVGGVEALVSRLFPLATLITPNLPEAEVLLGHPIRSLAGLVQGAQEASERWGCAVLLKGGHLRGAREAVDIFCREGKVTLLKARFIQGIRTHGTGCTYSARIAGELASGQELLEAVRAAKRHVTAAIQGSRRIGEHWVLGT